MMVGPGVLKFCLFGFRTSLPRGKIREIEMIVSVNLKETFFQNLKAISILEFDCQRELSRAGGWQALGITEFLLGQFC